jgi:adenylate cyclase
MTTTETRTTMVALNADVVGYSRLLADDYESTTATLAEYRHLVDDTVEQRGGKLANFVGDSFMAVFDSVDDAIGAAIDISREVENANAESPPEGRVRFRMGLDQGEVGITDGGYHGDALNVAARIQAIARPGGISVSGDVYRALDEPALRFRPLGRQALKNIPEHVDVYEFTDLPSDETSERTSLALETPTVAVLPIHTEMTEPQVASAAEAIRRDVIHRLADVPELKVVDAGSEPRGSSAATPRYMLESGAHQLGDQVRVYFSLLDVTTMNIVKGHKWDSHSSNLFSLGDQIADEVARDIEVELIVGEPAGLYAELEDPDAIEHVYLGWHHLRAGTQEGWAKAVELFGKVAESHPDQTYGHVLVAFALWMGASNGWAPDTSAALAEAREAARRSLELGDPTGMAMTVEAAILIEEGKADEALEAMEGLEIIRPTCDVTYGLEGSVRRYLGEWEKAVELTDVAMRLTGINKPWYPTVKACSLFVGGKMDEAASIAEMVLQHQPNNLEALLVLTAAQSEMGLERRARATADLIRERFPSVDVESWLENSPYQRREIIDRWKGDLASAGVIGAA